MFDYLKKRSFVSDRRGQVTIFIILAVLVVAGIVLVIMLTGDSDDSQDVSGDQEVQSPSAFLESCMEQDFQASLNTLMEDGGYLSKPPGSVEFKFGEESSYRNVSLVCYSEDINSLCINREPIFGEHLEEELKKELGSKTSECWDSFIESKDDSKQVNEYYDGLNVNLRPKEVSFKLNSSATISEANSTKTFENPSVDFSTDLYRFSEIVQEITNSESSNCDFEYRGHNLLYPDYNIEMVSIIPDGSKIYSIESDSTGERFIFAVRSCVTGEI